MNKKLIYVVVAIVIIAIVGIGVYFASQNKPAEQVSSSDAKQEEFVFSYDNKEIKIADEFTTSKYGEEIEYSEIASCAFEGLDKTYKYEHYEITTFPDGDKDRIFSIYFLDEKVSTKEGVKISDSYDDMVAAYGTSYTQEGNVYTYLKGKTKIEFIVENNVITSIEYVYNV